MKANTDNEVVDAVRWARERSQPLEIIGNGTKRAFGRPIEGEPLDVSGLTGIVSYEPEELIISAKPGTRLSELRAALTEKKQQLGFDPPEWAGFFGTPHESTIGGILCVDAAGSARLRYGGPRDHLLGIHGVNGFGERFRAGGRVVKNVTGFDIPKLVCGSFGTLCVLTEVTLRVFPKPASSTTLALRGIAAQEGLSVLRRVWSSPLESSGLAYLPQASASPFDDGTALIRLDGAPEPLSEKLALARSLLGNFDVHPGGDDFDAIEEGSSLRREDDVWRIYASPAQAFAFLVEVRPSRWVADWAGSLLWVGLPAENRDAQARLSGAIRRFRAQALLMRAGTETRKSSGFIEPCDEGLRSVTAAVKAAFDPDFLFNRGRLYEGL